MGQIPLKKKNERRIKISFLFLKTFKRCRSITNLQNLLISIVKLVLLCFLSLIFFFWKLHKMSKIYNMFQIRSQVYNFVNKNPKFMKSFQFKAFVDLRY